MFGFSCPLSTTLMKGCSVHCTQGKGAFYSQWLPRVSPKAHLICQRSVKNIFLNERCSCTLYRMHRWVSESNPHTQKNRKAPYRVGVNESHKSRQQEKAKVVHSSAMILWNDSGPYWRNSSPSALALTKDNPEILEGWDDPHTHTREQRWIWSM